MAQLSGRSCAARPARRCERFCKRGRHPAARRQGFWAQRLQDRLGAARHRSDTQAGCAGHAAVDLRQEDTVTAMASYIGTATSRVDGRAKVTGDARYAGEFNVPGLVHGYVVEATIPKGRIARIATSHALSIAGVIDVLTHINRPPMADKDDAYKDDVAPEKGSPYRPLYEDRILFAGQTVALALAEDWETARVAATQVKIEYQKEPHVTELRAERSRAFAIDVPEKPRGDAEKAFASAAVRHAAEYSIPSEHHNPMELFASTAIWENGELTVYDKTQGVQNVQQYLCKIFKLQPDAVRVMSPFMGGGFGAGLRPQYQV